jgi:hypothetical protein
LREPDWRTLPVTRKRRNKQALHAERRPIALRILDQLVGFADPDRTASPLQPIVQQNAGDLSALASPGPISQEPAAAKADGILRIIARCRRDIKGRINRPEAAEKLGMCLTGVNDALELRVRQDAFSYDVGWQVRPIRRLRRGE